MKRDYYEILGVDKGADEKQIKKAYRALAHRFHPDVNDHDPDTEEKFKEATEAYEILSDPEKRNIYDTWPRRPQGRWGRRSFRRRRSFYRFWRYFRDLLWGRHIRRWPGRPQLSLIHI